MSRKPMSATVRGIAPVTPVTPVTPKEYTVTTTPTIDALDDRDLTPVCERYGNGQPWHGVWCLSAHLDGWGIAFCAACRIDDLGRVRHGSWCADAAHAFEAPTAKAPQTPTRTTDPKEITMTNLDALARYRAARKADIAAAGAQYEIVRAAGITMRWHKALKALGAPMTTVQFAEFIATASGDLTARRCLVARRATQLLVDAEHVSVTTSKARRAARTLALADADARLAATNLRVDALESKVDRVLAMVSALVAQGAPVPVIEAALAPEVPAKAKPVRAPRAAKAPGKATRKEWNQAVGRGAAQAGLHATVIAHWELVRTGYDLGVTPEQVVTALGCGDLMTLLG